MKIEITAKVDGKEVPLSTVSTETFEKAKRQEPKYQFRAGDVVRNSDLDGLDSIRIIVKPNGQDLTSFNLSGTTESIGQQTFECCNYEKIGTLKNCLSHMS